MPFPSRDLSLNSLGLVPVNILTRSPTVAVLFPDLLRALFLFAVFVCLPTEDNSTIIGRNGNFTLSLHDHKTYIMNCRGSWRRKSTVFVALVVLLPTDGCSREQRQAALISQLVLCSPALYKHGSSQ